MTGLTAHPDIPVPRLAAMAAMFKLDEARYFIEAAKDIQDPRKFRYNFDATVEAIVSALKITEEALAQDRAHKRWFKKRKNELFDDRTMMAVYDSRISAHHRAERAPLVEVIEVQKLPVLATDIRADPGNPYSLLVIVRKSGPPDHRRRYWAIEVGNDYLPAVECCNALIAAVDVLMSEVREKQGLSKTWPPNLGKITSRIIEMP